MMKYGIEYAKKVFELIPEANFVAVDSGGGCDWHSSRPECDFEYWIGSCGYGILGKVECDDWKESLISREDVGL